MTMTNKLFLLLLFIFSAQIFAQDKAEAAIQNLDQNFPQEKVYLHFNKNSYFAGEKMWFKAYIFDSYNLSATSTNLFVELYDSSKKLIDKKFIPIYNGETDGNFTLSEKLKEDVYFVRAYTTWMTNFSEDFQYLKPITIYNPSSSEKLVQNKNADWSFSAHPEGGTFIEGIDTKFAVRMQSKGTPPSNWKGYVTEKENPEKHIAEFNQLDQNVALFSITPEVGKKYQLTVSANGNNKTIDLPEVANTGLHLEVSSYEDAVQYVIKTKNLQNPGVYKVIATIGSRLVYRAKHKKINSEEIHIIPTNVLINGVLQITLFDDKENVVAKRLCFVKPQNLNVLKPTLQNANLQTEARKKSTFTISTNENVNNYAVAIYDPENTNIDDQENLLSTFWLTGDLTSTIYAPAQYFSAKRNPEALDALLMSEQWKRFNWEELIAGKNPTILNRPEKYISYDIKILSNGMPAKNASVILMLESANNGLKIFNVKTDNNGFISFKNLTLTEPQTIYYQINGAKDDRSESIIKPSFKFVELKKNLPELNYQLVKRKSTETTPEEKAILDNYNADKSFSEKVKEIEEVRLVGIKKTPTEKLNDELSSPMFNTGNEDVYDFVNNESLTKESPDLVLWLQSRIAGMQVKNMDGETVALYRNKKLEFYLDEMQTDLDQLKGLNTQSIAMIKVIKDNFFGSSGNGDNGAVLIYTKIGSNSSVGRDGKPIALKSFKMNGYDKKDTYSNLDYESNSYGNIQTDNRNTLYWNPNQKSSAVEFYNNDKAKKFRIIIFGMDKETGKPIYQDEILP